MPGMTATANIYTSEIKDVLTIGNKALRFNPDQKTISVMMKGKSLPENNNSQKRKGRNNMTDKDKNQSEGEANKAAFVWVKRGTDFFRARIETGLSDGSNTEIKSGLNEGDDVVASATVVGKNSAPAATERSPFMPQRRPTQRTPSPRR